MSCDQFKSTCLAPLDDALAQSLILFKNIHWRNMFIYLETRSTRKMASNENSMKILFVKLGCFTKRSVVETVTLEVHLT